MTTVAVACATSNNLASPWPLEKGSLSVNAYLVLGGKEENRVGMFIGRGTFGAFAVGGTVELPREHLLGCNVEVETRAINIAVDTADSLFENSVGFVFLILCGFVFCKLLFKNIQIEEEYYLMKWLVSAGH